MFEQVSRALKIYRCRVLALMKFVSDVSVYLVYGDFLYFIVK